MDTESLIDLSALKGKFEAESESEREENETAVIRNRNRRAVLLHNWNPLFSLSRGKKLLDKKGPLQY